MGKVQRLDQELTLNGSRFLYPGLQMLHRLDLQGHGAFVVLYVLELHIQEADLALEAFHGI